MEKKITNLVFAGGGVRGIAYAGVIKVLDDTGILEDVTHVAGCSAGSIAATLIALNYDADNIESILDGLDLKGFEDNWDPFRLLTTYGIYSGNNALAWFRKQIINAGLAPDATFQDLHDAGGRELHVIVTDLNSESVKDLNIHTTPDVILAEAIRASISIPLFFKAWQFSNNEPDDHIYVDGGAVQNYALTIFDHDDMPNPHTLGFEFSYTPLDPKPLQFKEPGNYIKKLLGTVMHAQAALVESISTNLDRSVIIDTLGIQSTRFDITDEEKVALYDSGKKATLEYLDKQHIPKESDMRHDEISIQEMMT